MFFENYDIIATLGPCSDTKSTWEKMVYAGVNGFRLNTSHLTLVQLTSWIDKLCPFLESSGLALVIDLQGSKWRCRGYKGVVLSDETAIGRYPVECCQTAAIFRMENSIRTASAISMSHKES